VRACAASSKVDLTCAQPVAVATRTASIATAGASQSEDHNDKQKIGFFDSIDPKQRAFTTTLADGWVG
jgi:hypothetical protein